MHVDCSQAIQLVFFALKFLSRNVVAQYHYDDSHQYVDDFENMNFNSTNFYRSAYGPEWVLLYEVPVLTFEASEYSAGSYPGPQLQCVGGTAGPDAEQPVFIICFNYGLNEAKDNFRTDCKLVSRLPGTKLGKYAIVCEYYSIERNSWLIYDGSCIIEYELDWDEEYEKNCATCVKSCEPCILTADQFSHYVLQYGSYVAIFFLFTWSCMILITILYFRTVINAAVN